MIQEPVLDTMQRAIRDLRISVTDKCNFRCTYCMPKGIFGKDFNFLPQEELLTFEEITRLIKIFTELGTEKIRLTGGEPLMRKNVDQLVEMISKIDGLNDIAMTTNGSFPIENIKKMKKAGLHRFSVSLDSLDDETFKKMNDVDFPVGKVLKWIKLCEAAGMSPVKINMVVKRGVNDDSILPMAKYFNQSGTILRFIEYMDVGTSNGWRLDDVVSAKEIIKIISKDLAIEPVDANYKGEVAARWRYKESGNEIGIITSVTQPFCSTCTRIRLSANGALYTCLFAAQGHDLKGPMRAGKSNEEIKQQIIQIWQKRADRYSDLRSSQTQNTNRVEMSFIGG
jgi:GTP 3',8-cyclase